MSANTTIADPTRASARRARGGEQTRRLPVHPPPPRLGVACAGSLARFFTIFGALARLADHGVSPTVLSGSSSGALAAVLFARFGARGALEVARDFCREGNRAWGRLVRPRFPTGGRGWITFRPLAEWMESHTGVRRIEDLPRKVVLCVTDAETGEPRYLSSGPLGAACAATCSFALAEPIKVAGRPCVDGGYSVNLPVGACYRAGADVVIALDPSHPAGGPRGVGSAMRRVPWSGSLAMRDLPDVAPDHWLPLAPPGESRFDLTAWKRMIEHGYRAAGPLARLVAGDLARSSCCAAG